MRTVGLLPSGVGDIGAHDHVACVGSGSSDLARIATQAFATAPTGDALMLCLDAGADWEPHVVFAEELGRGRLEIVDNADAYAATRSGGSAAEQLSAFDAVLRTKLAAGFTGIRVVADNTSFLTGSAPDVQRWLAWEQRTDRWQAERPVTGVCWFDRHRVPPARLAAALNRHPASTGESQPTWRLHHDHGPAGPQLRLSGEIEHFDVDELLLAIEVEAALTPGTAGVEIDVSDVDYLHHRALSSLARRGAVLRNEPPIVQRMADVCDR